MPLPLVTDKLDAIPEAARGAFVERDGKFYLDATIEDTAGLKAKNAELLTKNRQLSDRAKVLGDRTPEEVQADLDFAKEQREKKARDAGDYESLKKIQADELAKRDKALSDMYDLVAKQEATTAIATAGGKIKKLLDPVLKHVKVVVQDGKPVAMVVDAKGNPRIVDGQATPMTIDQLVAEFAADDDYAPDFSASGANGSGARNESAIGRGGIVQIPKDADTQTYRRMKADAEKRGVPYQIAS